MENRKSFILHFDSLDVIEELTDEQAWKLFKKMKSYHNGNTYDPKDKLIDILFIQFKNQFDRDLKKYENICDRNKRNGLKWWRPNITKNNPVGYSGIQDKPKQPYNDNKSDSDSKNDSKNNNKEFNEFYQESLNISIESRNATQFLVVCFYDLWYVPAKNETVESFREWLIDIAKLKSKSANEMIEIINSWHTYWKDNKKPVKNHKASLLNHYSLKWK